MSIKCLQWAYNQNVKGLVKFVLLTLGFHANENNQCWPSIKLISEKCGITKATAISHIDKLSKLGLITKQHRHDKYGYRRSSLYTLNINCCDNNQIINSLPRNTQSQKNQRSDFQCQSKNIISTKVKNFDGNKIESSLESTIEQTNKCEADTSPIPNYGVNSSAVIQEIFSYWQEKLNHPRARLDSKRKSVIKKAFNLGYSIEDLKKAITGCAASPFHCGDNDRKQVYDNIGLILKDADHIERFMNIAIQHESDTDIKNDLMIGVL